MTSNKPDASANKPRPAPDNVPPIKLPNPDEAGDSKTQPEIPKVGSRDAPGG